MPLTGEPPTAPPSDDYPAPPPTDAPRSVVGSAGAPSSEAPSSRVLVEELLRLGTATIGESGGSPMGPRVRAVWRGARLAAPAYPVQCTSGDNLAVHVAVARAPVGSVLAVDVGDEDGFGYWGEVLTTAALSQGIAGLVIDGGVRDTDALEAHGFPVFSTTVALRGASKHLPGTVGATARVGDVLVSRGDWLVGDADGVCVIASTALEAVLAAARTREQKERTLFAALRQGRTTLELLGLDPSPVDGA